ncbi:MAG: RnfABCDGE type electron transport complex subunit D [Brevinema sp.]
MKVYDKVWSVAPFLRSKMNSSLIMREVLISLFFVAFASVLLFGYAPIVIFLIAFLTGGIIVFISRYFYSSFYFQSDTWKISTLIFCLSLPPTTPWYIVVIGVVTILFMTKWLFAIESKNIFNPALIGRILVMTLFPNDLFNRWVFPLPKLVPLVQQSNPNFSFIDSVIEAMHIIAGQKTFIYDSNFLIGTDTITGVSTPMFQDALTGPTYLISLRNYVGGQVDLPLVNWFDLLIGNRFGAIGETSMIILFIAFLYLVIKKIIDPWLPIIYMATIWLVTYIFGGLTLEQPLFYFPASLYSFYGGAMFVAIFMLTDYGSTPINQKARYAIALLGGFLVAIARIKWHHGDPQTIILLFLNFSSALFERIYRSQYYAKPAATDTNEKTESPIFWSKIILASTIAVISFLGTHFIPLEEFQSRKDNQNQQILRNLFDNYVVTEKITSDMFKVVDENQEILDVVFAADHGFKARTIDIVVVFQGEEIKNIEILPPYEETRGIGDKLYFHDWEKKLIGLTIEDLQINTLDLTQYAIDIISGATQSTTKIINIVKLADEKRKKYLNSRGKK